MSGQALVDAAVNFVTAYHAHEKLVSGQEDWDCLMSLHASDTLQHVTIAVRKGRASVLQESPGKHNLVVTSSAQILLDILHLRLNPNQPYIFGELTVSGRETDFTRVDYIASVLCAGA